MNRFYLHLKIICNDAHSICKSKVLTILKTTSLTSTLFLKKNERKD